MTLFKLISVKSVLLISSKLNDLNDIMPNRRSFTSTLRAYLDTKYRDEAKDMKHEN